MVDDKLAVTPQSFTTFGDLLRYLRRRARLTQRTLGIAVGYSEGHINRFEKNKHLPDPTAVAALFIPELDLNQEPLLAARLIELATPSPTAVPHTNPLAIANAEIALEAIPETAVHEIPRRDLLAQARYCLDTERHLLLCGLAGMGKTTLAAQIARDYVQTMPVLWFTLTAGITTSADVMVRQMAVFLATNGQESVRPLISLDPRARASLTLARQMTLIATALSRQPALLCFDNAELIQEDEACRQILSHLAATTPIYLLLTARASLALPHVTEITLNGFTPEEGLAFITHSAPHLLALTQAERLIERTGGSPMLLRLALGKLTNEQTAVAAFITHLETQPQVAAYLLQTVRKQVSAPAWRLLLLLAVLQQPVNLHDAFLVELAFTVGDIGQMGEAVAELQRHFLIQDATHAHLPPLVRDYVYSVLTGEITLHQRLHRLAGDWFRGGHEALAAAWHYSAAGLLDMALEVIETNMALLIGRGQALPTATVLDDVQAQIGRLRTETDDLLRRVLIMRGTLLVGTLRVAEGEASLRQAIILAGNPAVRANIIYHLAELIAQRSEFEESLRLLEAAQAELAANDLLLRARLAGLSAIAHNALGHHPHSHQSAQEALSLAEQMVGWPHGIVGEIRARAYTSLADAARARRDLTGAMAAAQLSLTWARAAGHMRLINLSLAYVGGLYYDLGDLEGSFRHRQEALAGMLAIGDVHSAAYFLTYLANIHFFRAETTEVLQKLGAASETLRIVEDKRGLAAAESLRAQCLLWCGEVETARHVVVQMLQETVGKSTEQLWGYRLEKLALVQLVNGEMAAALATLQQTLALPAVSKHLLMNFQLHSTLAMAYTAVSEPDLAAQTLAQSPRLEGLSRWAELERSLVEGYVALSGGDRHTATHIAGQVMQWAEPYALYRQKAKQLQNAVERPLAPHLWPRQFWVCTQSSDST